MLGHTRKITASELFSCLSCPTIDLSELPIFAYSALHVTEHWFGAISATVISDPMVLSAPEAQPQTVPGPPILAPAAQIEVEFAICDCCGLTEECTPSYIERVRERYFGKWICGLCAEAIKDEIARTERLDSAEEAMIRHMNFCQKLRSPDPPTDPTILLISAMRQILRKGLDSRSTPGSPTRVPVKALARCDSCFPTLHWPTGTKGKNNLPRRGVQEDSSSPAENNRFVICLVWRNHHFMVKSVVRGSSRNWCGNGHCFPSAS